MNLLGVAEKLEVARPQLIGNGLEKVRGLIERIAEKNVDVLIGGETGTGKEIVAKLIHETSRRRNAPFIAFACPELTASLIESELFGHEKGAFTGAFMRTVGKFAQANGGTIFLDEVSCLSLQLQYKFLRVLQEREVIPVGGRKIRLDLRVISATNRNLREMVDKCEFRSDLYYRLKVAEIYLQPLVARKDDLPDLIDYFLSKYGIARRFDEGAMELMARYSWSGNVRELENLIRGLDAELPDKEIIMADDLPHEFKTAMTSRICRPGSLKEEIKRTRKFAIESALSRSCGSIDKAAKILGITVRTLHRERLELGIRKEDYKK